MKKLFKKPFFQQLVTVVLSVIVLFIAAHRKMKPCGVALSC